MGLLTRGHDRFRSASVSVDNDWVEKASILFPRRNRLQNVCVSPYPNFSTDRNVSLPSKLDGSIAVAGFNNLTINAGHTLTVANRCKGLKLIVRGNLIVSGTISMYARGAYAEGAAVELISPFDSSDQGDVPAAGGAAGGGGTNSGGGAGTAGTDRKSGGGGGGGGYGTGHKGGNGSAGTSYSGGTGGGGTSHESQGGNATANGGPGGQAFGNYNCGGGSGNPGGLRAPIGNIYCEDGLNGTGGLLIIWCLGNITINAGGLITCDGPRGGNAGTGGGGGATGGGSLNIFHYGSYTNNGTVRSSGGVGGTSSNVRPGGPGGVGCVTVTDLSA